MDNFRAAWDWAVNHSEFALIDQTMRMFSVLYDNRGWLQEGLDTLERAITALEELPSDRTNQISLGHILASRAVLASRLGHYDQAQAAIERSLDILRPLNEPRVLAEVVCFHGVVMELTGNFTRALESYTEGLETATNVGDRWYAALCNTLLVGLAGTTQNIVAPEITHERLRSALAEWRDIGDPRFIAVVLNNLSWNALALGFYKEAHATLEESAALSSSVGDRYALGFAYRGLGIVAQAQGEHLQALEEFQKGLDTLSELGARQDMARLLAEMSRSIFELGNDAEAERNWREALRIAIETKGLFIALESLVGLASFQAKQGEMERALELVLIVLNHPAGIQDTKNRAEQLKRELEMQLTSQQVERVQALVQIKTFEVIVDQVLKQAD
jgi:tetratricopeptide (TPR) repeat protein